MMVDLPYPVGPSMAEIVSALERRVAVLESLIKNKTKK